MYILIVIVVVLLQYIGNKAEKRRVYEQRILEIEHATFIPLVMSTTGWLLLLTTPQYTQFEVPDPHLEPHRNSISYLLTWRLRRHWETLIPQPEILMTFTL